MLTDPSVFDEGWVPADLPSRDGETGTLAAAVDPSRSGATPALISGPPGTGKTATTRWVLNDLHTHTDTSTVYVDAWTNHRPYQLYGELLMAFDQPALVQPQTPRTVLRQRIREHAPDSVVVVLDEADQLDELDVIAHLNAMEGFGAVLIVNDQARFGQRLRRETSVDLETTIAYDAYTIETLVNILRPRAREGLEPGGYRESRLEELAQHADGNARVAIQGLRAAADHARQEGHPAITPGNIEAGVAAARNRIRRKTRSRLTRHERVVLEVVEDIGNARKGEIYTAYVERVGEEDARGKRRVGDYLSKLESYNQIEAAGEKRGRVYHVRDEAVLAR
ncbi:Cdc6/Cdc18 family protein [Halobacterium salinarum]|uniref:Cdc6/Cdc18 family protein n=1 Tax=Halobacterium salinarum TaxID=2242 RepID=UPI0030CA41B1